MPRMFSERDLQVFERLRRAFDPAGICNPGQGDPDAAALRRGARAVPRSTRSRGSALPSVSSLEEAAVALAAAHAEGRRLRIGDDLTAAGLEPDPRARSGRPHVHGRGGSSAVRASGRARGDGQRLSLDPPGDPTIGALLARNVSGPLRHRFGAPRDLVLGATLVLADGTIASAGGKVVKNVAGYDLARLVCGSEGRLAFIARASFRLHPLPKATRTLVVETDDAAAVAARSSARSCSRARSTSSTPAASPCCSRDPSERSRRSSPPRRRSSAAPRRTRPSGTSRGSAKVPRAGRVRFAPGELATRARNAQRRGRPPGRGRRVHGRQRKSQLVTRSRRTMRSSARRTRSARELDPQGVLAA